jgi:seryl-tRNA synthetase
MEVKIEHRLTEVEERSKSNSHRLDEVEKRQDNLDKLVGTVSLLAEQEKRVEADVKEVKADVKDIASKSGKRWDNLINQIITIIVAAVAGFFLAKFGL